MESTDDMEHLLFKRVHICFLGTVKFIAVKNTFSAAACRTYISAGVTTDTFAQLALEESKFFFRAHSFDSSYFIKTICIFGVLGLADDLVIDLMFFAFTYMTSLQHTVFVSTCLLTVDSLDCQCLGIVCDLGTLDGLNTFDSLFFDLFDIQFSFTSHTNDVGFVSVYSVLFDQLVEAVSITGFQTYHGLSFQFGSFDHIFA